MDSENDNEGELQRLIGEARSRRDHAEQQSLETFTHRFKEAVGEAICNGLGVRFETVVHKSEHGRESYPSAVFKRYGYTWTVTRTYKDIPPYWQIQGKHDERGSTRVTPGFNGRDEFLLLLDDLSANAR